MIAVRPMRDDERDTVVCLLLESRKNDYAGQQSGVFAFDENHFRNQIAVSDETFVADDSERIVGTISVSKIKDGLYSAGSLVVAKESRGKGVGAALLDAARFKFDGTLVVALPDDHAGAARAFARAGFKKVGIVMETA